VLAVGLLAGGAGFAVASVPDGSGTFHACVLMQTTEGDTGTVTEPVIDGVNYEVEDGSYGAGNLTMIDPSAGQTCDDVAADNDVSSNGWIEQPVSWSQVGPAGPQGATGAQGIQGPTGPTGSIGPTGSTGPTGSIGPTGSTGPAGAQGSAGAKGDKGDKGDTGDKGAPGKSVTVNPSSSETDVAAVALSNPLQGPVGETTDSSSTKLAFDALSVDYQASSPNNISSAAQGAGSGKITAQTITITKVLDSLSPTLLGAAASRQEFKQALIVIPTKGANKDDLRLVLTDVVITNDHISTSVGAKPTEQLTLAALGVKIEDVKSTQVSSGLGSTLPAGWSQVLNTADQDTTAGITSKGGK
jgi:type VI protein secretion system component Hcp